MSLPDTTLLPLLLCCCFLMMYSYLCKVLDAQFKTCRALIYTAALSVLPFTMISHAVDNNYQRRNKLSIRYAIDHKLHMRVYGLSVKHRYKTLTNAFSLLTGKSAEILETSVIIVTDEIKAFLNITNVYYISKLR